MIINATLLNVGPGTIFIFGLSSIDFTRCVPGYKTRSYLFSTPRIRRESIRQEWALSLIRRYPSPQILRSRPHCDVCGWTEVSLSPGIVIAHWSCYLPFWPIVFIARPYGVLAHRPCMLTGVNRISQRKYLTDCIFNFLGASKGVYISLHSYRVL